MPGSVDRVRGEVEPEGVTLGRHALGQSPRGIRGQPDWRRFRRVRTEQACLAALALVLRACRVSEDRLGARKHPCPFRPDRIEDAGSYQPFELPSIEEPG